MKRGAEDREAIITCTLCATRIGPQFGRAALYQERLEVVV
jgi:hypothetical protein